LTALRSESGTDELWVYDLARTTRVRSGVSAFSRPIWSPDGRNIAFQKNGSIYTMPSDDSGPPTILLQREAETVVLPLAWSRDRTLVFSRPSAETNRDVHALPAGGKPRPFLATTRDERSAMLSPDGRWMVYQRMMAVTVRTGPALSLGAGFGRTYDIAPDGRFLFIKQPGRRLDGCLQSDAK
jgi:Tol biopolymer transport system component